MTRTSLGLYGLGTMGSALALNIADNGFDLHVANRSPDRVGEFMEEAGDLAARLHGHDGLVPMIDAMNAPRTIILMVPAGKAVDDTIDQIRHHLVSGDTIVDAGNADFNDTRRRTKTLEAAGLNFVGMGVSGGEEGARHGPSIMVGGSKASWDGMRPVAEAIAAKHEGEPCAAHLGPDGAGHFVKTVHNGIEYAEMQMIAEVFGIERAAGRPHSEIGRMFDRWNEGPLKSYLIEITGTVLAATDHLTGGPAVEEIVDKAGQKGTGRWTMIEALKLGQSASVIEAAVGARGWSSDPARAKAAEILPGRSEPVELPPGTLEEALIAGRVINHAQGFGILSAASTEFKWQLDMARIAEIWRAGCIIRSAQLDAFAAAFRAGTPQGNLALAPDMVAVLKQAVPGLRAVVAAAVTAGQPVPALAGALGWYDTMTKARGTASLIQAQRDFFGRHGFARVDGQDDKHGPWWRD